MADESLTQAPPRPAWVLLRWSLYRLLSSSRQRRRYVLLDLQEQEERTEEEEREHWNLQFALEEDLRSQISGGRLIAAGFRPGEVHLTYPSPEWWADARLDFAKGTASAHGSILSGVRISGHETTVSEAAAVKSRFDYRDADRVLVGEMIALIHSGQAKGPMDAAQSVAKRAAGSGKERSKVQRLLLRFAEVSGHSGQY